MKLPLSGKSFIAAALLAGLGALPATAQNDQAAPAKPAVVAEKTAPSSGVADILKMLDAGVSKDVIKVYIENSPAAYNLTSADLIALKERGVSDELSLTLLNRNKTQAPIAVAASAKTDAPAVKTVRIINSGRLDPESYEYFQHYYLQARSLAYTYQTLGYQSGPYSPYGYGYYPYAGYGPYFPGRYAFRPLY